MIRAGGATAGLKSLKHYLQQSQHVVWIGMCGLTWWMIVREFLYQEVNKEAVGRQQDFHIRLA